LRECLKNTVSIESSCCCKKTFKSFGNLAKKKKNLAKQKLDGFYDEDDKYGGEKISSQQSKIFSKNWELKRHSFGF
jgi:hypothetical protein